MTTTPGFQRTYDHRLKNLVFETGDIKHAVKRGVPHSTARGWLRLQRKEIITLDVLEAGRHVLPDSGPPTLVADSGVENVNGKVDELIESGLLRRVLALVEIDFSNSLIEYSI